MRKRPRFKSRTPPPMSQLLFISFLFVMISTFLSIWYIDAKIKPVLMDIAKRKQLSLLLERLIQLLNLPKIIRLIKLLEQLQTLTEMYQLLVGIRQLLIKSIEQQQTVLRNFLEYESWRTT